MQIKYLENIAQDVFQTITLLWTMQITDMLGH